MHTVYDIDITPKPADSDSNSALANISPAVEYGNSITRTREPSKSVSSSCFKSPNFHKILYPIRNSEDGSRLWSGLDPLVMVERLAKMAIDASSRAHESDSFLRYLAGEEDVANDGGAVGQKRKRDPDEYYDDDLDGCELVAANVLDAGGGSNSDTKTAAAFHPWKILDDWCRVYRCKITDKRSLLHLNHLVSIIKRFEDLVSQQKNDWVAASYGRAQLIFMFNVASLTPDGSVYAVIDSAVKQVNALMEMIQQSDTHLPRVKFADTVECSDGLQRAMAKPNPTVMNGIILSHTPLREKAKKQLFNSYLVGYVCQRKNWINPYLDAVTLKQMANYFIGIGCVPGVEGRATEAEAAAKISTWLLNFRTRQWRPALESSFDLKRPAMLLIEDSLRVFKGDALRPLVGWDSETLFADRGDYSKPVAIWDIKDGFKSDADNSVGMHRRTNGAVLSEVDTNAKSDSNLFPEAQSALTATLDEFGMLEDSLGSG